MPSITSEKPSLRPLDFQPIMHEGQRMWYLRDPLQVTDYQLLVPAPLAQMLVFCDGKHTLEEIHAAFAHAMGGAIDMAIITQTLARLDEACLLNNAHFRQVRQSLLDTYRRQPHRPPALADLSYPGDPVELIPLFASYSRGDNLAEWSGWQGRAIISPHIDYQRGGRVYAKVWQRAIEAIRQADLVLIFGTDHNGGFGTFTLTQQAYATPFGVLPADLGVVNALAEAITPEAAYEEELHHRQEHSVELSAVWLHAMCQQAHITPPPMVPILCGSFHHFVMTGDHPVDDPLLTKAVQTLRELSNGRRVLAVASVDFAHVGPNFGDQFAMDRPRREKLRAQDQSLMEAIVHGDAAEFYRQIEAIEDSNRICGFSSIYLMLRYLYDQPSEAPRGQIIAYEQCPADPQDTSLVSIGGLLLD